MVFFCSSQGWCGEVRDVIFSDGNVTVVYRITVRGLDGEVLACEYHASFLSCLNTKYELLIMLFIAELLGQMSTYLTALENTIIFSRVPVY